MAQMFYEQDCSLSFLEGKKIAIVGYGSQGHAHALNLKDSGCDVVVALYEGSKSWKKAEEAGLTVMTTAEAAKVADLIMILINDEKQAAMYEKDIAPLSWRLPMALISISAASVRPRTWMSSWLPRRARATRSAASILRARVFRT